MTTPFDFIASFSTKTSVWGDAAPSEYIPFVINRGLSFIPDSIHYSNMMNRNPDLPTKMQHDFYFNAMSKKKRYSSWIKADQVSDDISLLCEYYSINKRVAAKYAEILSVDQLQTIRDKMNHGGAKHGRNSSGGAD